MEGVDFQLCYHQRFRANSGYPLTGFPTLYHSPQPHLFGHTPWFVCLTATGLLRLFGHLPIKRELLARNLFQRFLNRHIYHASVIERFITIRFISTIYIDSDQILRPFTLD